MSNINKKQSLLQQKDKNVLKSWKTYAIAAGLIVIGTGIGVGVYYGVNANSDTVTRELSDQDISNAIVKTNYTITKVTGTTADVVESEINANFIHQQLTDEVKSAFNASLFSRDGKIMIQEQEQGEHGLTDTDLATTRVLNATIKYNYGAIKKQEVKLTITVTISDAQMIVEINKGTYQLNEIEINTSAAEVQSWINNDFIKEQLTEYYQNNFDNNVFKVNSIMIDNQKLEDKDLTMLGPVNNAEINYTYGAITATVDLEMNVVGVPNDENIWQEIIDTKYQLTIASGTTAAALNGQVPTLIQSQLSNLYQKYFEIRKFIAANIYKKVDNEPIIVNDDDLKVPDVLTLWVKFGYGSVEPNGETEVTVTLT